MSVKQEVIELMELECKVCKHIAKKIPKSQLNYRPSKAQRSTLELMRFLSFFPAEAVRIVKLNGFATNQWEEYEKNAKKSETLKPAQFAKAMGARVIAAASSQVKLDLCKRLGADELINYETESLRDRVNAITGKCGVDVVCDPVGGRYTEEALRVMAWHGRLLVIGFAAGDIPKIPVNLALLRERSIVGVYWGDSVRHDPDAHHSNVEQLLGWLRVGTVAPHISERVPLSGALGAMQRMSERQVTGKVIVLPRA